MSVTHHRLLLMIEQEQVALPLAAALKCLGVLISNTPYQRLQEGYIGRIATVLNMLVAHKGGT